MAACFDSSLCFFWLSLQEWLLTGAWVQKSHIRSTEEKHAYVMKLLEFCFKTSGMGAGCTASMSLSVLVPVFA
jgi:hypothetical protein